jgi:hypothetical protein
MGHELDEFSRSSIAAFVKIRPVLEDSNLIYNFTNLRLVAAPATCKK